MKDLFDHFYAEANTAMKTRYDRVMKATEDYNSAVANAYSDEQACINEKMKILFDTINMRVARMLGETSPSEDVVGQINDIAEQIKAAIDKGE